MTRVRTLPPTDETFRVTRLELRAVAEMPPGVCGQMTGVALVYNQVDDFGTLFLPGCLDKTRAAKLPGGKIKLFADHGPFTHTHVGVVRALDDLGDGAVLMSADLFDTEAGRKMKEYLDAVIASASETGLSVGFRGRESEWQKVAGSMESVLAFKEIELREISVTPVPAVPGTDVTSVRHEGEPDDRALLARTLRSILKALDADEARAIYDEVYAVRARLPLDADAAASSSAPAEVAAAGDGLPPAPPAAGLTDAGSPSDTAAALPPTTDDATLATPEARTMALRASYANL